MDGGGRRLGRGRVRWMVVVGGWGGGGEVDGGRIAMGRDV